MTTDRRALAASVALAAAIIGLAATAADPAASAGSYRIVGYNDMDEMLTLIVAAVEAEHPDLDITLDLRSTRSAPAALIAGTSLLAPMGAAMQPADRAAFRAAWGSEPVEFRVAHDSLTPGALSSLTGVLVGRFNPLRRIDLRLLRRIFAPTREAPVTRWGQLGARGDWSMRTLYPVALAADTAIGAYLLTGPLHADRYRDGVRGELQSRDVAATVAADPLAIGLANLNRAGSDLRALAITDDAGVVRAPSGAGIRSGRYPLDRFLLVYARRGADGHLAPPARLALDMLLSARGQALIARGSRGYLRLNEHERSNERRKLN